MNYRKVYIKIIKKAKSENRKKGQGIYYENHHILPKSIFPLWKYKKRNHILLTAREHYICHLMLAKIWPKKMSYALWNLVNNKQQKYIIKGSKEYDLLRQDHSVRHKKFMLGKSFSIGNLMKGKRPWNFGLKAGIDYEMKKPKGTADWIKGKTWEIALGKKRSLEIKEKISKSNKGHIVTEETKMKLRNQKSCKRIECLETGEIFYSAAEAGRLTGINKGNIRTAARNNKKAGGFYWRYI